MSNNALKAPDFEFGLNQSINLPNGIDIVVRELTFKEYTSFGGLGRSVRAIYNDVESGLVAILKELLEQQGREATLNQYLLEEFANDVIDKYQDDILDIIAKLNGMEADHLKDLLDFSTADEICKTFTMLVLQTTVKKTLKRMESIS